MQLTLGKKKYKSVKPTMGLVRELVQLSESLKERETILNGDDKEAQEELIKTLHPLDEIEQRVDLIIRYFGKQFTEQEFMDGFIVNTMQDFHELIYSMIAEAVIGITLPVGGEKK